MRWKAHDKEKKAVDDATYEVESTLKFLEMNTQEEFTLRQQEIQIEAEKRSTHQFIQEHDLLKVVSKLEAKIQKEELHNNEMLAMFKENYEKNDEAVCLEKETLLDESKDLEAEIKEMKKQREELLGVLNPIRQRNCRYHMRDDEQSLRKVIKHEQDLQTEQELTLKTKAAKVVQRHLKPLITQKLSKRKGKKKKKGGGKKKTKGKSKKKKK